MSTEHRDERDSGPTWPDDLLDAGLAAGFAGLTPPDPEGETAATGSPRGFVPPEHDLLPARYEVEGVLGEGGMGIVYRARDRVMGRPVAIKVLKHAAIGSAQIERFWEEAQIASQLTHPGIVPVYELARTAALDPYFTMKLVEGETLKERLQRRGSPEAERRTLIAWLLQVCQVVAYAHARGVIHRDLKPANIMLGSFGEVHVMDWGLAKVLSRDVAEPQDSALRTLRTESAPWQSQIGSVLGTPSYMSPEQACGKTAEIDQRSDVFTLGVILSEVLSGQPVWSSAEGVEFGPEPLKVAIAAACGRLAAAGIDGGLAGIVEDCLAWDRSSRPADASVLAQRLSRWLELAEERARAAELAALEARVRVENERRLSRVRFRYAAGIVLLLLAGAVAWVVYERNRRTRVSATARAVAEALDTAVAARARARAAGDEQVSLRSWVEAEQAARRASEIARAGVADDETLARAGVLYDEVLRAAEGARLAVARRRQEAVAAARLDEILQVSALDLGHNTSAPAAYEAVFHDLDIDLDSLSAEDAVERIRATTIADRLVSALDYWALILSEGELELPEAAQPLAAIARAADPDPVRARIRAAWYDQRPEELLDLARSPSGLTFPAGTAMLIGSYLASSAGPEEVRDLYLRRCRAQPGSFWNQQRLAVWSRLCTPPDRERAVAAASAAVALLPESGPAHLQLAQDLLDAGRLDDARSAAEAALGLCPDLAETHAIMGMVQSARGAAGEAERSLRQALVLRPGFPPPLNHLGELYRQQGRFAESADIYGRIIASGMANVATLHNFALALRLEGQRDEAEAAARRTIAFDPESHLGYTQLGGILGDQGRWEDALEPWREALRLKPDDPQVRTDYATALFRSGDPLAACAEYEKTIMRRPGEPRYHVNYAQMLRVLGRFRGALDHLRLAQKLVDRQATLWKGPNIEELLYICDRGQEYEERLLEILSGRRVPSDIDEWVALTHHCRVKLHFLQEAMLWERAFDHVPELIQGSRQGLRHRYRAFTAALLAGLGEGYDAESAPPTERQLWRGRAREWLKEELAFWGEMAEASDTRSRRAARELRRWVEDPTIARLREALAGGELSTDEEAPAWNALLAEIESLHEEVR